VFDDVDVITVMIEVVELEVTVTPSPGRSVVATPAASFATTLTIAPCPSVAGELVTLERVTLTGAPAVVTVTIVDTSPDVYVVPVPADTIIWYVPATSGVKLIVADIPVVTFDESFVNTADTAFVYAPNDAADLSVSVALAVKPAADAANPRVASLPLIVAVAVMCFEVAGAEITFAETIVVSPSTSAAAYPRVMVDVTAAPARATDGAPAVIDVAVLSLAAKADGIDVSTPRPKAATATSAMRLKVVFVDICFLSISRSREFP
jgi:hypothetical protein